MVVKHCLTEPEESPRAQKRSSSTISSDTSSPYFSAPRSSPAMPDPLPSYPSLDPALLAESDADDSNSTASAMTTASNTLQEMEKMSTSSEAVEEHIRSVTPVKPTADNASGGDMLEFSPSNRAFLASSPKSEYVRSQTEQLSRMSKHDREELFRARFEQKGEVKLQNMCAPELCTTYSDYADEILDAYLSHTCFTAKVWANYDSVERALYSDPERLKSCGKLDISPKQCKRLENLDSSIYQFKKVRLDVGTPFRVLFEVHLDIERSGKTKSGWDLGVSYQVVPDVRSHRTFEYDDISKACVTIQEDGVHDGRSGLTFDELEAIALEFRFKIRTVAVEEEPTGGSATGNGHGGMHAHGGIGGYNDSNGYGNSSFFSSSNANGSSNAFGSSNGSSAWDNNSRPQYNYFDQCGK